MEEELERINLIFTSTTENPTEKYFQCLSELKLVLANKNKGVLTTRNVNAIMSILVSMMFSFTKDSNLTYEIFKTIKLIQKYLTADEVSYTKALLEAFSKLTPDSNFFGENEFNMDSIQLYLIDHLKKILSLELFNVQHFEFLQKDLEGVLFSLKIVNEMPFYNFFSRYVASLSDYNIISDSIYYFIVSLNRLGGTRLIYGSQKSQDVEAQIITLLSKRYDSSLNKSIELMIENFTPNEKKLTLLRILERSRLDEDEKAQFSYDMDHLL